jgi:hypothetical protein
MESKSVVCSFLVLLLIYRQSSGVFSSFNSVVRIWTFFSCCLYLFCNLYLDILVVLCVYFFM